MKNLARLYRPKKFSEVIGQESAITTILNSILDNSFSHAYVFTGPRGIGKTTIARIIAKSINCLQPSNGEPCSQCHVCIEIDEGISVDVLEIDGASYTNVDNIREVQDIIRYAPVKGKYRVIIIDEFHMLSKSAFNALLKTIEEPPDHVVFIFATTEPEKVPETVMSRCQRFDLKKIPHNLIYAQLKKISEKEGIRAEDEALGTIARESDGSLRDAISLLEQIAIFSKNEVELESVERALGIPPFKLVLSLFRSLSEREADKVIEISERAFSQGIDPVRLARDLMEVMRHALILREVKGGEKFVPRDPLTVNEIKEIAKKFSSEELITIYRLMGRTIEEIIRSPLPDCTLEVGLIKICLLPKLESLEEIIERFEQSGGKNISPPNEEKKSLPEIKVEEENKSEEGGVFDFQKELLRLLEKVSIVTKEILSRDLLNVKVGESEVTLKVREDSHLLDRNLSSSMINFIEDSVHKILGQKVKVVLQPGTSGKTDFERSVEKRIHQDPLLKKFLGVFDAKIVNINVKGEPHQL